jgi:hypothetical protein
LKARFIKVLDSQTELDQLLPLIRMDFLKDKFRCEGWKAQCKEGWKQLSA